MMRKGVREPYFTYIAEGVKRKEGRVYDEKSGWTEDMVGREVTIFDGVREVPVLFTGVRWYDCGNLACSIREMLAKEGVTSLLPDLAGKDLEEGVKKYLFFNRDKGPKQTKIGAFDFRLL